MDFFSESQMYFLPLLPPLFFSGPHYVSITPALFSLSTHVIGFPLRGSTVRQTEDKQLTGSGVFLWTGQQQDDIYKYSHWKGIYLCHYI